MNEKLLKAILETLQTISNNLSSQNDQLDRLNDNIESVTGSFKNRSFINVSATVHEA